MQDVSCCGIDCGACECRGNLCVGCNACEGRVFHAPEGGVCPIYDCVRNKKGLAHCGQCREVPCTIWKNTRDPKFTDEEFAENMAERVRNLAESV